jgi:hypothetical protein
MDITWQLILIGLVLLGALLLIISYIWIFIIQQSPLRLIIMVLRSALNRDRLVDENAPIEVRQEAFRSDAFTAQTEALKQNEVIGSGQGARPQRPHAVLPADEVVHKPDETTTDSGWPLDPSQEENSPRPFLKANYRTQNEDIQEQQGNL